MKADVFTGRALHLHVTGSISAALVPWWLHWFRSTHADVVVNVSLTPSAGTFVTLRTFEHLANGQAWLDSWDHDGVPSDVHSGRSASSEAVIVFPATLDTLMRLAQGRSDSPAMLMLQVTTMPIVIADAIPGTNSLIDAQLDQLRRRNNVAFAPRVSGVRATSREEATVGFNLPGALMTANTMLCEGRTHE